VNLNKAAVINPPITLGTVELITTNTNCLNFACPCTSTFTRSSNNAEPKIIMIMDIMAPAKAEIRAKVSILSNEIGCLVSSI
jgi:hypothetical protein